jgi:hypothetical protein
VTAQSEAKAILTRRMQILASAPSFSSLRFNVPQLAVANWVWARAIRRSIAFVPFAIKGVLLQRSNLLIGRVRPRR